MSKEDRIATIFTKEEFNLLMHHLKKQNNQRCIDVIRKHFFVKKEEDQTYIYINYFGNQLRDIVYALLHALPAGEEENVFDEFVELFNTKPRNHFKKHFEA